MRKFMVGVMGDGDIGGTNKEDEEIRSHSILS